jgi:glycosyltransferase involved in cell wall biosynthesis
MRVLYVCNDHAYFERHRRWLADAAVRAGAQVMVAAGAVDPSSAHAGAILPLAVDRHHFNAASDWRLARRIAGLAAETKADIVHLITIKPVLYGALGLRRAPGVRRIIAGFPGLGRVFDQGDDGSKATLRRALVEGGLRLGLKPERVRAVFETRSDLETIVGAGLIDADRAHHIAGAGVDPSVFVRTPLPPGPLKVLYAGRLIRSKGVMRLVEAFGLLRAGGSDAELVIAGLPEPGHPDSLNAAEIASLPTRAGIRYLGETDMAAMPALIASAHIVALPTTYPEGVPRILIEALASGRPVLVSDAPGCRAIMGGADVGVVLGSPAAAEIASSVSALAADPARLGVMAEAAARRFDDAGFSTRRIEDATLRLYSEDAGR